MATNSQKVIDSIFQKQTPLKEIAGKYPDKFEIIPTYPKGKRLHTPKLKGTIWGNASHLTMSLLKSDVIDRRLVCRHPMTVDEIVKGAFSEANKDLDDMPKAALSRADYGALVEEGGRKYTTAWTFVYPFPCQKSVGQIIVGAEDLKDAKQPEGVLSMKNGQVKVAMVNDKGASVDCDYLMCMKRNIVAVNVDYKNLRNGLTLRLFRNQDQGHRKYMDEKGNYIPKKERAVYYKPADPKKPIEYFDLEADAHINGPFEAPVNGTDGRFFWIYQKFPAEKTFPEGFEYVIMGIISDPEAFIRVNGLQKGLGTLPKIPVDSNGKIMTEKGQEAYEDWYWSMERAYELVRNAPGVAVTAEMPKVSAGSVRLYAAVVTSNETKDIFAEAKKQLLEAEKLGYEGLLSENTDWYDAFYDKREEGRIVYPAVGAEEDVINTLTLKDTFHSWSISDAGHHDSDPRRYEGSEDYASFDMDTQSWHSLPCYNEIFSEPLTVRNQTDRLVYYSRLLEMWHDACKEKAKIMYGLPGMIFGHGYLPPTVPDPWYMENQALELCMDVPGQVVKVIWSMWDYTGDVEMLKNHVYPITRDLATFFEAFARRNYDGKYYNVSPVVETEGFGISYRLTHTHNTTGALTMFKKILKCAIEGAELLGVDADLIPGWREVMENLAPYPKCLISSGEIFAGNPGVMPRWASGDHPFFTGDYPASLADEINLDSPQEEKDIIARTNDTVRTAGGVNQLGYILVGKFKDHIPCDYYNPAILIDNHEKFAKNILYEYAATTERLINSRSGRIHLFPVTPDWIEVAFRNCLARGGFVVSAAKDKEGVKAVVIKARRSIPCKVMNPWASKSIPADKVSLVDTTTGKAVAFEVDRSNGECITFKAEAGHEYSLDL